MKNSLNFASTCLKVVDTRRRRAPDKLGPLEMLQSLSPDEVDSPQWIECRRRAREKLSEPSHLIPECQPCKAVQGCDTKAASRKEKEQNPPRGEIDSLRLCSGSTQHSLCRCEISRLNVSAAA
jgi:hypothetical protein